MGGSVSATGVGVVGLGAISAQYLDSLRGRSDVRIAAVCDLDESRAREVGAQLGVPALPLADLVTKPDVDVVLNLTVPAAHAAVHRAAIDAGRHAFGEKPLAGTAAEASALVTAARERGVLLASAPDTVLGTGLQTARAAIDDGAIGRPVAANVHFSSPGHEVWHPAPDFYYREGAGPLFDMGPYFLTALVTLLGPVTQVSGVTTRSDRDRVVASGPRAGQRIAVEVDTHVAAVLVHEGGAVSTMTMSFEQFASRAPVFEVHGTAGSLAVPDPNSIDGPVALAEAGEGWRELPARRGYAGAGRGIGVIDLVAAVRDGREPRCSAELAAHVVEVMGAVGAASIGRASVVIGSRPRRPVPVPYRSL